MKKVVLIISILLIHNHSFSNCDTCKINMGMNLYTLYDWGTENPFVNIMKFCRSWGTQNMVPVSGGQNPWNTGVIDLIPQDAQGYPLELPYYVTGQETLQVVYTVWTNTPALPAGEYVVLYDGDGEINFWCDAVITSQSPGRIAVNVSQGSCNMMQLKISRSTLGNHVRNIRFLMPGTEFTYQTQPYNQNWLNKLAPFKTIRFMDWGSTNNSPHVSWNNRAQTGYYTWNNKQGVPYEEMSRLCNFLNADMWINIPHKADNNYIAQMANLVKDNTNPNLKIYVEFSNEIWNPFFEQTTYLNNIGNQSIPWPERIVPYIQNALDIWTSQFAGQLNRIVRVVGVHSLSPDVSERICFNMNISSFDAVSSSAFFAFTPAGYTVLGNLGASATVNDVKALARDARDAQSYYWVLGNKEVADQVNKKFIIYEGGQHLTPYPFGSVQPYNQALMDIQTDSSMYNIYNEWFEKLRTISGNLLFMHYAYASPKQGESGSWGALENVNQNPPFLNSAPKYQALLDNMIDFKSLQLTVLIEGFYNAVSNTLSIDNIKVYLRNVTSPYSVVDSCDAFVNSNGEALLNFSRPLNGVNYYIQIKHRNSIETWSKFGGESFASSFLNYDFTTSRTQAYGNNLILKGSRYCIYSGDVNQDGSVRLSDLIPIHNDATNFVTGNYLLTDITGDGNVNLTDVILCHNNSTNFVNTIHP